MAHFRKGVIKDTYILVLDVPTNRVAIFSGNRNNSTAGYNNQSVNGNYWSSSPYGIYGYNVNISGTQVNPLNNNNRSNGFSVRCLKN